MDQAVDSSSSASAKKSFITADKGHMPARYYWGLVAVAMLLVLVAESALFKANLGLLNVNLKSDLKDARSQMDKTFEGLGDYTNKLKEDAPKMPQLSK